MNPTIPKTGLGSTAETNRLLGGQYFNESTGSQIKQFTPTAPSTTFNAGAMAESPRSLSLPPTEVSTLAPALSGEAQGVFDSSNLIAKEQAKIDKATKQKDSDLSGIQDTAESILKLQSGRAEEEDKAGINQMSEDVNKANQAYLMSQRAETNELRAISERADISLDAKQQMMSSVQRKYAFQNADNALALSLARQDLATAEGILNKKYELQLEPLKTLLDFQQFFYKENKEDLSKAEQTQLELMISENERQYNFEMAEYKQVGDLALLAGQNGAPSSLVAQISNAKTTAEARTLAARYLSDPLDRAYKQAQIDKINSELGSGGGITPTTLASSLGITPEQFNQLPADTKNSAALTAILGASSVGQGTKTQIANVLGVINASRELATARADGKFEGLNPLQKVADFFLPEALMSDESTENRGYLDAINLKVQQWASGASLTAQQIEQVNRFTPKVTDSDSKVRTKLNNLTNFMLTQIQSQLQSEGIQYTPEKINLFEVYDMLKEATPEQKEELKALGLIK